MMTGAARVWKVFFLAPLSNQYMMHRCSVRLAVVEVLQGGGGGGGGVGGERERESEIGLGDLLYLSSNTPYK